MPKCLIQKVIVVISLFIIPASVTAQQDTIPNKKFNKVRSTIIEAVTNGDIPSMSVAVAKNGKIIWQESFGWANREKKIKATPNTMYSMASISKPIATTGLMTLVEKGRVSLDDPVNKYITPAKLTAYQDGSDKVTVRHILNHTSGLPSHYSVFYIDEPLRQPPAKLESVRRYGILVHPPGEVYQYANFGFSLADHIIEKVSGRSFTNFMKREVFVPLGMMHTSIDVAPGLEEYAAVRYDGNFKPVPFYISDHPGASQVYCSAHDLIKFAMFHLNKKQPDQKQILKKESVNLMKKDSDPNPDNNRYGLGWFLLEDDYGYSVFWHTGTMRGACNKLKFVPSENLAVVVLINGYSSLRVKIPNDIIGVLLPEYGKKWAKERDKKPPRREEFKPVSELTGKWEGEIKTYEDILPVKMIFQEDGDVHIYLDKQLKTLMNNVSFRNNTLTGASYGSIPSGDAQLFRHNISYKLKLKDNRLCGYVSTSFQEERSYGNFSSYIVLEKMKQEMKK